MQAMFQQDYVCDPRYVVNHDIMNCTADGVVANHLYSGRALGITSTDDLIQLHPELEPLWPQINAHYERIGLTHTHQVIWDLDRQQLGMHEGYEASVFYFGPNEYHHWQDSAWYEAVDFINSKNNFMRIANELDVVVPYTVCFDSVDDITEVDIKATPYPCYLKAAISVAGVGIYRCEDRAALQASMQKFGSDVPVQIQEEITTEVFLNLQYRINGNRMERLTASEQILDGFAHQGNRVPASHAPWESVEPLAEWLQQKGMRGIFAFDVAVLQTEYGLRFPAIECNPRFNGASYPTLIAEKLGICSWASLTLSTQHRTLSDIDLSGIEYSHESGQGVIIVNWGTVLEGKMMVLLAGDLEQQKSLEVVLRQRL